MHVPRLPRSLLPLALAASAWGLACAEVPVVQVHERAPAAARPRLLGVYHSTKRPSRQSGALVAGEVAELRGCPFDPRVAELPPGGGLLLRLESPVPLDLVMQLETSQGGRLLGSPEDNDDEELLFRRGLGYFYENAEITRGVKAGKVTPRELALWPGSAAAADRRVDLAVRTRSFDPRASGEERESAALVLSLVGKCPDLLLTISKDAITLLQGASRRLFIGLKPIGDGVRTMKTTLSVENAPPGLAVELKEPQQAASDWTSPRDTVIDLTAAKDAPPTAGPAKVVLKASLGGVERKISLDVTIKPKPE